MKAMKRILSVLLCMAMVIGFVPVFASAADGAWTLVTDASTLAAGDQVVIVANGEDYALSTTQNTNNRGQAAVTKNGNTVTLTANVQILTLEAGTVTGTFALNTGSGYLYAASSSGNNLKTKAALDNNGSFKITIADGTATIVAQGDKTRNHIRYNSASDLFSCYASTSNMAAVCLYKWVETSGGGSEEPTCDHTGTVLTPGYGDTQHWDLCECGEKVNVENHTLTTVSDGDQTHTTTCSGCDYSDTVAHEVENYVCTANCGYTADCDIPAKEGTYIKVTEALTDWSGTYLIVYEDGSLAFNGAYTDLDVASNTVSVAIADNKIAASGAAAQAYFVIEAVEGGYSIKSSSGYYVGQTSNANGLKANASTQYVNTLGIDNDQNATIVSGEAYLRFNAAKDDMRFRYYKSSTYTGQKAIALYKLAEQETASVDVCTSNVNLGNSLAVSFYVKKADIVEGQNYYMQITKKYADGRADATKQVPMSEWTTTYVQEIEVYRVDFTGIAAKEMGDDVTAQVFLADGTAAGSVYTESVKAYAEFMLEETDNAELKTLLVDMLNYGAAAQERFNYDKNNLVNADLTPEQSALATQSVSYKDDGTKSGTFYGDSLTLESNIILQMYFQDVTSDMHAVVEYQNHSGTAVQTTVTFDKFELYKGTTYRVPVNTMAIADGNQVITCTLYNGSTEVGKGTSSVATYLSYMAQQENADAIYSAALKLIASSYAYFH